jgi:branched-subunit amino acid transport protein
VNVWLTMLLAGILTFAIRLSFILLFGRMEIPPLLRRALRFVPPAVLTAIVFPELLVRDGSLALYPGNARLLAGILAAAVAWRTKNISLTIVVGMMALFVFQMLFGD